MNKVLNSISRSKKKIEYIYNQNGDLIKKPTEEKYAYDIQGNLTFIAGNDINQSFTCNGNGNRKNKTVDGDITYFLKDMNRRYEQVLQADGQDGNTINPYHICYKEEIIDHAPRQSWP